jgi:hypothetical protein
VVVAELAVAGRLHEVIFIRLVVLAHAMNNRLVLFKPEGKIHKERKKYSVTIASYLKESSVHGQPLVGDEPGHLSRLDVDDGDTQKVPEKCESPLLSRKLLYPIKL